MAEVAACEPQRCAGPRARPRAVVRLAWLFLVCLVSAGSYAGPRCGPNSCLEIERTPRGMEVRVVPRVNGIYACYLRYENTWWVDEYVSQELGPVRLRDGYPPTRLLFRCDPLPGCAAWMREREMCDLADNY